MDKKLSKGYEKAPLVVQMMSAGIAGCFSDVVTFPTDTLKVRAQLQGEGGQKNMGLVQLTSHVIKNEGFLALYKGLVAGLQRQFAFASVRIGVYDQVKAFYNNLFGIGPNEINIPVRILAGMTSGCIAVAIAQPTDVVKIRFQGGKGRYKNTRQAYSEILRTAGFAGLWQGVFANMTRNALCNVTEVVVYDIIKDTLLKHQVLKDGVPLHVTSAILAGFITTIVISPVDVTKTRYMNAPAGTYKNARDCAMQTINKEGFLAMYKGFTPNVTRIVSWNLVMWLTFEQIKIIVARHYNKDQQ